MLVACGINGCKRTFRTPRDLTSHQESSAHLCIPYYCPLTAEHCPRAPCDRSQAGIGPRLIGRLTLYQHLRQYHAGHTGATDGLDLSLSGLASFRDTSPGVDARVAAVLSAPSVIFNDVCRINYCKQSFTNHCKLTAHQESSAHLCIPYYCPLTADHCPRAPCDRSKRGSGPPIIGRKALLDHLRKYHSGHTGAAAGLDLSWSGLASFRNTSTGADARVAAALSAPSPVTFNGVCGIDGCKQTFRNQVKLTAHQ